MPFKKGNSGNPFGQKRSKEFAAALRIAIKEAGNEGGTKLRNIADALILKAASGDVQAIREIADRLDGKAVQGVQMDGNIHLRHEEALEQLK